jgi:tripartite-type tricarboxylate transporter receptor subunit TctC
MGFTFHAAAATAALLLALAAATHAAEQQPYPSRPVRLIVANTPGGAPDVVARLVAARLSELWGQSIVVDNRPGATGMIAAEAVARAAPDGYTLWLNTMTQLIATLQAQRYMLAKEFAPVSLVASTPFVIVVGAQVPVTTLAEWIAYAKARPADIVYGSGGTWGSSHLCMESINALTGITATHVPYKGATQVLNDLAGGRVHAYCPAAPSLPIFVQSGKIRALAQTYTKLTPLAPGLPPVAETIPGFELLGWYGMQMPLKTPPELVNRINADLVKVLKMPDIQERLFAVGAQAVGSTPAELGTFLANETKRWDKLLRESGGIIVQKKGSRPERPANER